MQIVADRGAEQWFPDGFVPEILELLLATWEKMRLGRDVRLEPRITNLFSRTIEEEYTRQEKDWFVHPETKEADPITGKEISRTDIRLYHRAVPGQKLYFVLEAKRLHVDSNGEIRGGYGEYVGNDGMMCFITGKYSRSAPSGGMVAYVMDGDVTRAAKGIKKAVQEAAAQLKLIAGSEYGPTNLMPQHPWNGETRHQRSRRPFGMYHLLLPVPKSSKK